VIPDLTDDEQRAWNGLLAVMLVGMPRVERTFREHGLVHIEYGLLVGLAGGPRRLTDLATVLNMSASRLSHRLSKLVDRGYVRLAASPDDRRVTIAEITDEGRALMAQIAPGHLGEIRRVIFDHLDPAQTAALAEALSVIGDRLGACVDEAPGPRPPASEPAA
jgi:DNA-binding MarR family transcriptional regulator